MKKILFILLCLSAISFTSCSKDDDDNSAQQEQVNPATEFVGKYIVSTEAHLQIPIVGNIDLPWQDMDATIALKGNNGDVTVSMAGQTTTGYVNDSGLHIDPIIVNQQIMSMQLDVTVTFPVIHKPVNGTTSWTATLSASSSYGSVTGTADMTAVKQ